jgi:hypothetical protein
MEMLRDLICGRWEMRNIYWSWIAGKILTGELLELDVEIAAEKKRDKNLEGK